MVASLNNLNILAADVGNVYLNAVPKEKVHVKLGKDIYGPKMEGRYANIVRALYGLQTSGAAWWSHLQNILQDFGFKSCYADSNLYLKPDVKPDGSKYYSYCLVYVDGLLVISEEPQKYLDMIRQKVRLKEGSIGMPETYLGTSICKRTMDGEMYWAFSANKYLKEAIKIVEGRMRKDGITFTSKATQPFSSLNYRPKYDESLLCDDQQINFYQNIMGVLRWLVELGRIDINFEVSQLSRYLMQPRMDHLQQALNIFNYLKSHDRLWVVCVPRKIEINWTPGSITDDP